MPAKKPKPKKKRTTKAAAKKAAWKRRFLDELRERKSVAAAAKAVGKDRSYVYKVRNQDSTWAAEWDAITEETIDVLETSAMERACNGWWEITYDRDTKPIRQVRRYSDALTIFMLKKRRPQIYSDFASGTTSAEEFASMIVHFVSAARRTIPNEGSGRDGRGDSDETVEPS